MGLFNMHYDRPGPGVNPDTPRKKGAARFAEVLGRDMLSFWCAGMLALLSALPFALGLALSLMTHAVLPMLVAGALGGMIAAPQLAGLQDTILRSLRDEPGYWWATYRQVWKRNLKGSLLPGAVGGLILAMQIFAAWHLGTGQGSLLAVLVIGLVLLGGLAQYLFAQVALLDLPFASLLKNAVLLPAAHAAGGAVAGRVLGAGRRFLPHQRAGAAGHQPLAARAAQPDGHLSAAGKELPHRGDHPQNAGGRTQRPVKPAARASGGPYEGKSAAPRWRGRFLLPRPCAAAAKRV